MSSAFSPIDRFTARVARRLGEAEGRILEVVSPGRGCGRHGARFWSPRLEYATLGFEFQAGLDFLPAHAHDWTDLPENHFDAALVEGLSDRLPSPGLVLQEIRRVLRPGGLVWVADRVDRGADSPDAPHGQDAPIGQQIIVEVPGMAVEECGPLAADDVGGTPGWWYAVLSKPLGPMPTA